MEKWNDEEIKFLKENYIQVGVKGCQKFINKNMRQIRSKANRIGLTYVDRFKRYEYEIFKPIVEKSFSISEVSRNLGLTTGRGNRKTIQKYILKYNISTDHFKYVDTRRNKSSKKIDLLEILVSGSTYTNIATLKQRLYREKLLYPICKLCGQDEFWNGMKISLILDHINGVNNDHRLENLRILCPNCNAGQDTFCRGDVRKRK